MKDKSNQSFQGPQTNICGDANDPILSGLFQGPVTINYNSHSGPFRFPLQKPPRPDKFIGREKELADLLGDLQSGRPITICGPGGIGKTALVAEAIWRLAPDNNPPDTFPDGIIFHDFYRQPQAALALEAIARSYGEDLRPSLSEAARRALAGRQALLVLDGTEAADDLEVILSVAGSCGILITTHRHSDAPADWSDLPPLPLEFAVQLLQVWGKEWAEDKTASYKICNLLGGLPLAVFLAGRYLSQRCQLASEYLTWLEETPLEALDLGARRHQSVPLLMEQSLKRVSKMGRAALGVTGVLALQPFEPKLIQIAQSIKPRQANHILGELVNYGLLKRSAAHYQVNHSLIRAYARERLVVDSHALSRLIGYYISFIKKQCSLGLSGYSCLDAHRAHILALQSACHEIGQTEAVCTLAWVIKDYLNLRGYWTEHTSILEKGLSAARIANDCFYEGAFLTSLGSTCNRLGEYRRAKVLLEQAFSIAQEMGDRKNEGGCLINISISCNALGEYKKAIELCDQVLSIAKEIGDKDLESAALNNMGIAYYYFGETRRAIEFYEKDLAIVQDSGSNSKEASALCCLGVAYSEIGENHRAIELYEKFLAIASETGDRQGEGNYLCNMGIVYNRLGDSFKAIQSHERSLVIFREIGDRLGEGNALYNSSLALNKIGERRKAIDSVKSALKIFEKIESPQAEKAKRKLAELEGGE